MIRAFFRTLFCLFGAMALSAPAYADVDWLISGMFDDGTYLSGSFTINQYGFIQAFDITTTGGTLPGYHYFKPTDDNGNSGATTLPHELYFQPDATSALVMNFEADITGAATAGGVTGFECFGEYTCPSNPAPQGAVERTFSGSTATVGSAVPEPAVWTMMILGFGAIGASLRAGRRARIAAHA